MMIDIERVAPPWPPPAVRDVESTTVYPWYVVVATAAPYGWHTPRTGVTGAEVTATTAMCAALHRSGPGALGVVKRALHHLSKPDYEYRATVCTATIDPVGGNVVVKAGPR